MMDHDFGPAQDAREQLRRWDGGGTIWSIEMSGIGPGYEQAIQTLAIEIVRDEIDKPMPAKPPSEWGDATLIRVDEKLGGLSGAQFGAARALAYKWLTIGPAGFLKQATEKDRYIQVSAFWPSMQKTS